MCILRDEFVFVYEASSRFDCGALIKHIYNNRRPLKKSNRTLHWDTGQVCVYSQRPGATLTKSWANVRENNHLRANFSENFSENWLYVHIQPDPDKFCLYKYVIILSRKLLLKTIRRFFWRNMSKRFLCRKMFKTFLLNIAYSSFESPLFLKLIYNSISIDLPEKLGKQNM